MTISEIIQEVKNRVDVGEIHNDAQLVTYINELEGILSRSLLPRQKTGAAIYVSSGTSDSTFRWDAGILDGPNDIYSVYIDGVKAFRRPANSGMEFAGYELDGENREIAISNALLPPQHESADVTFVYRPAAVRHIYSDAETDKPLAESSYHLMYVYYVIAQVAAVLEDSTVYANAMAGYNQLYSEYYNAVYKNKLSAPGVISDVATK